MEFDPKKYHKLSEINDKIFLEESNNALELNKNEKEGLSENIKI
jgi:hypothetical protein